jgi:iron complex outermembrane receptor protein
MKDSLVKSLHAGCEAKTSVRLVSRSSVAGTGFSENSLSARGLMMSISGKRIPCQRKVLAGLALFSGCVAAQPEVQQPELITVTASRRVESINRVDISLSVINSAEIESLNLLSLPELASMAQNVSLFEDYPGAGIPTWVIRGVGLQDFNSNNTPAAAVYLDGSYQVSTVMGAAGLFDTQQVEILKGPQGGLYGRNTSGGAVLLNTRRARQRETSGYIQAGYGSWERSQITGAVNFPVTSTLAMRLSMKGEASNDGWQQSISSGETHGERDRWDFRSWMAYEPNEAVSLQWKIQGGYDNSDIPLGRSIGLYDKSVPGDFCSAALAGMRDDANCISFAGVNQLVAGNRQPENIALQALDGSRVYSDPLNRQGNDYVSSLLELSVEFSGLTIQSLTTFDNFGYGVDLDLDGSEGEYGHRLGSSDIRVYSQELRLLSADDSPLQWLAGLNWTEEDFSERRDFNLRDNGLVGLGQGKLQYEQETSSFAAFADASYGLAPQWRLDGTLRYTDEEKTYSDGAFYIPRATPIYFVRNLRADYALDENFSGSVSLNWIPDDDRILYLKYSRGFKSGGFYGGFPFRPAEIEPYREETIAAWELGFRQNWADRNLQMAAAVFHYDYQDVQGFIRDINPITGTGIDRLANQGDASHDGMELELLWRPMDRLRLELGLGWLDAVFTSSSIRTANIEGNLVPLSGRRPWAPRFNGYFMAGWQHEILSDSLVDFTLLYDYRSTFSGAPASAVDKAVNELPGYGLLQVAATLTSSGTPWEAGVWVRNLLDKEYRVRTKGDGLDSYMDIYGEPRSVGFTLQYMFGK